MDLAPNFKSISPDYLEPLVAIRGYQTLEYCGRMTKMHRINLAAIFVWFAVVYDFMGFFRRCTNDNAMFQSDIDVMKLIEK